MSESGAPNKVYLPRLSVISSTELPPKNLKLSIDLVNECQGYCLCVLGHLLKPHLNDAQFESFQLDSSPLDNLYTNESKSVFILHYAGKLRVWLPSEAKLLPHPHSLVKDESGIVQKITFETEELNQIYEKSCKELSEALVGASLDGPLIGSLSELWVPVIGQGRRITYYNPCQKWIVAHNEVNLEVPLLNDSEVYWSQLEAQDVDTIIGNNALKFDPKYVEKSFRLSSCLRSKRDGSPVCWAMTHWDLAISSIHTTEEHRRKGYAKAVLINLIKKQADMMKGRGIPEEKIWLHADIESYNEVSISFFKNCGFKKALDNLWIKTEEIN